MITEQLDLPAAGHLAPVLLLRPYPAAGSPVVQSIPVKAWNTASSLIRVDGSISGA